MLLGLPCSSAETCGVLSCHNQELVCECRTILGDENNTVLRYLPLSFVWKAKFPNTWADRGMLASCCSLESLSRDSCVKELRCLFCIDTLRNTVFFHGECGETSSLEKYVVCHPRFHGFCWPPLRLAIPCLTRLWFNSVKPGGLAFSKGNLSAREVRELFSFEGKPLCNTSSEMHWLTFSSLGALISYSFPVPKQLRDSHHE